MSKLEYNGQSLAHGKEIADEPLISKLTDEDWLDHSRYVAPSGSHQKYLV